MSMLNVQYQPCQVQPTPMPGGPRHVRSRRVLVSVSCWRHTAELTSLYFQRLQVKSADPSRRRACSTTAFLSTIFYPLSSNQTSTPPTIHQSSVGPTVHQLKTSRTMFSGDGQRKVSQPGLSDLMPAIFKIQGPGAGP